MVTKVTKVYHKIDPTRATILAFAFKHGQELLPQQDEVLDQAGRASLRHPLKENQIHSSKT